MKWQIQNLIQNWKKIMKMKWICAVFQEKIKVGNNRENTVVHF